MPSLSCSRETPQALTSTWRQAHCLPGGGFRHSLLAGGPCICCLLKALAAKRKSHRERCPGEGLLSGAWMDGWVFPHRGRQEHPGGRNSSAKTWRWGVVTYSRQLHEARMLGAAGRGPWEVDEARAQGASCARLRSQGFSLWAAWPGGGQRAGIPTVTPSSSWVEAVLYWVWPRLKPTACWL